MVNKILIALGSEIRAAREISGLTQQQVADVFGWNRDAISKLERGALNITLVDYLTLIRFLGDAMPPEHPASALARHAARRARK